MDGPAARWRERYDEGSRQVGLFIDPDAASLRSLALEQLWREHMLAQLAVNERVTPAPCLSPSGPASIAVSKPPSAATRMNSFRRTTCPTIGFGFEPSPSKPLLTPFIKPAPPSSPKSSGRRYCDFERVFHLAMAEYTQADPSNAIPDQAPDRPSPPAPRTKPSKVRSVSRIKSRERTSEQLLDVKKRSPVVGPVPRIGAGPYITSPLNARLARNFKHPSPNPQHAKRNLGRSQMGKRRLIDRRETVTSS